jgi:hypothetical protein
MVPVEHALDLAGACPRSPGWGRLVRGLEASHESGDYHSVGVRWFQPMNELRCIAQVPFDAIELMVLKLLPTSVELTDRIGDLRHIEILFAPDHRVNDPLWDLPPTEI